MEWTLKENFPATSEPPPENMGHKKSKGEPPSTEWSPQVFAKSQGCLEYTLWNKKKPMGRRKPIQRAGVNYMVLEAALPTNPDKGRSDKRKINM